MARRITIDMEPEILGIGLVDNIMIFLGVFPDHEIDRGLQAIDKTGHGLHYTIGFDDF